MDKFAHPRKKVKHAPWGRYDQYLYSELGTVKILHIKPGERISLQRHRTREEFWRILDGTARVTLGEHTIAGKKHDEFFIPKETPHRLEAIDGECVVLAISYGHFDPADKERIEDAYGRASQAQSAQ